MPGSLQTFAARFGFSATSSLTALALFAGSASAADLAMPMKAPPPLPVFCWTGFYIGADVGYAWVKDSPTEYLTATNHRLQPELQNKQCSRRSLRGLQLPDRERGCWASKPILRRPISAEASTIH